MNRLLVRLGVLIFAASAIGALALGQPFLFWGCGAAFALWALAEWAL